MHIPWSLSRDLINSRLAHEHPQGPSILYIIPRLRYTNWISQVELYNSLDQSFTSSTGLTTRSISSSHVSPTQMSPWPKDMSGVIIWSFFLSASSLEGYTPITLRLLFFQLRPLPLPAAQIHSKTCGLLFFDVCFCLEFEIDGADDEDVGCVCLEFEIDGGDDEDVGISTDSAVRAFLTTCKVARHPGGSDR